MRSSRPSWLVRFVRSRGCAAAVLAGLAMSGGPAALAQGQPAGAKPAATGATTAAAPKGTTKGGKAAPTASASAGATPEVIDDTEEVQRLYMEGDDALKRNSWQEAEGIFAKAWALSKSFDVAGKLGQTKLEMGKHREAAGFLSFALRNAPPSTRPGVREALRHDLDRAKEKLVTVKLTASLLEAKITVDKAPIDPLFLGPEIFVEPGKHTFEASAERYETAAVTLDAKAGEVHVVTLTLERALPKGVPTAPPPPPGTPWPAAVIAGAGGLGLVLGAVFVGLAEASKKEAYELARKTLTAEGDPTCPKKGPGPNETCDQIRSKANDVDVFGNTGIAAFIAGGVLVIGAGAYALIFTTAEAAKRAPDSPDPKTGRLTPMIGPNGGGLVWSGSF